MSWLLRLAAFAGWQGAVGAAVGAFLAAVPAYHAGKTVEGAASEARISAARAIWLLEQRTARDEKTERALAARRDADRDSVRASDGRLPDDGYRRD